jgi:NADH-quinone oxidoreductase subunit H
MNALTSLTSLLIFPAGLTLILVGMFYEWVDRKLVARFQNRVGPRWFQPFADIVKLFAKEQITPKAANPMLFFGLPMIAVAGALTAALYVPLIGLSPVRSFPGDLIVTIYLLSLLTLCIGLHSCSLTKRPSCWLCWDLLWQRVAGKSILLTIMHAII